MNYLKKSSATWWVVASVVLLAACERPVEGYPDYDASKPIVCESFYPTGGPIATKVILTGSNFGNRAEDVSVFFTVDEMNRIYKIDLDAQTCTPSCGGSAGFFDGPISQTQFSNPHQMCRDCEGNLYVADTGNHCIRKINMKTGYVSTVAGLPQQAGYVNGTGEVAKFNSPYGLAIDSEDVLYVGDSNNHAIRRVAVG